MGDRKLGDLAIGFLIFLAVFGVFLTLIISFDNASNNPDNIGYKMYLSSNMSNEYRLGNQTFVDQTEAEFQSVTFDNNTFQAPTGQYIDTRGVSQGNFLANNYPSTITQFLKGIQGLFAFEGSGYVWALLIGVVVITGVVLLLRSFQGTFKW